MVYPTSSLIHSLILMALFGSIATYYPREEEYPEGLIIEPSGVPEDDDYNFVVKEYPRRPHNGPLYFMKRGVMMGVDLPDFLLNRNQQTNKNLQALRQRLFESGRRR